MNTIQLENIKALSSDVLSNKEIEVLSITNSELDLPSDIAQLKGLKELHLTNNTLNSLPIELLELEHTFIFLENNQPPISQKLSVIVFDLQRKTISKAQALLYFRLLQSDVEWLNIDQLANLIEALTYRVEEVRNAALQVIDKLLPEVIDIPENSVVSILGVPESFSLEDIRHRMKNVSVNLLNKLTAKTSHIVICALPEIKDKIADTIQVLSETKFMTWLNHADKQLLGENNEENKDALQNVSAMLLGEDLEHNEMALTMMKTHGVSYDLLTDLFIYFNKTDDAKLKRRAKTLFKKHAPKELLNYFDENKDNYYNLMEGHTRRIDFYNFLETNPLLDRFKISRIFDKQQYLKFASSPEELIQFIKDITVDGLLKIEWEVTDEIIQALETIKHFERVVISYRHHKDSLEWLSSLDIIHLDLYDINLTFPSNFVNFKNLLSINLPNYQEEFPEVLTQISSLEFIELGQEQFSKIPESFKQLTNLKTILMHKISRWDDPIPEVLMTAKKSLLPKACELKEASKRRS